MPYNELIKNFENIRDYVREFYIYGFKSREEYNKKSSRSYDDERRRIESWLGDYVVFHQTPDGKKFFISIDSRSTKNNPLYKVWKTKSFTDNDIMLYFVIFDILYSPDVEMSVSDIVHQIDCQYISLFKQAKVFDESTVRKKIKEYVSQGLLEYEKRGKTIFYRRAENLRLKNTDALSFFSEVCPCGVIGSFILDKTNSYDSYITFKHHYINQTLDSDILCSIFLAMNEKREIRIKNVLRNSSKVAVFKIVPLKIFISVQNGRQYLMGYNRNSKRIRAFRLDYITEVNFAGVAKDFDTLRCKLESMQKYLWGVSSQSKSKARKEYVEFIIKYSKNEEYIYRRLEREKRCGIIEKIDENTCRFRAEVYDSNELIPWIRTFICRITDIKFSNKQVEEELRADIKSMYQIYGLN